MEGLQKQKGRFQSLVIHLLLVTVLGAVLGARARGDLNDNDDSTSIYWAHRPSGITGTYAKCYNEGESVHVPYVTDNPCISCKCKNSVVECEKEKCPSLEGCYKVAEERKNKCCKVCKGCVHRGIHRDSDTEWTDSDDPCKTYLCKAGVITETEKVCYTPCSNLTQPAKGECCPSCKGCRFNGHVYREGQEATLPGDHCVRCICRSGNLVCSKQACPVLPCPVTSSVLRSGACCPECNGPRVIMEPPGHCVLGKSVLKSGARSRVDQCTNCTCESTGTICSRCTCPVIDCPPDAYIQAPGDCCPKCREPAEYRAQCTYQGTTYKDGEEWRLDPCKACECRHGQVHCSMETCNPRHLQCKPGFRSVLSQKECCPKCIEDDAVCTVFGDPHYKTFDGISFNFQGTCKYLLAADCKYYTFSVRVRNDARSTRSFSWTKAVTLKIFPPQILHGIKVTLGQRLRVKVNNKRVTLPHKMGALTIVKDGYMVIVKTRIGVKLVWDGESFLEVSVPPKFKNRLCGLCGNYNNHNGDDFQSRRGKRLPNALAFGKSWRVGGKKACARPEHLPIVEPMCQKHWAIRRNVSRMCDQLKSSAFAPCHKKVSAVKYYKACFLDMCECPDERQCHCEVFTAYAQACSRAGVQLDWRNSTGCFGPKRHARRVFS